MKQLAPEILISSILVLLMAAFFISQILNFFREDGYLKFINPTILILFSWLSGILFFQSYLSEKIYTIKFFSLFDLYGVSIFFEARLDKLASVFLCVISLSSVMISIYSISYKSINPHRIGSLLSVSAFFASILVISNNLFQMFVAAEALALCSYFFVKFRNSNDASYKASFKKIILYQLSGIFFLMGIFSVYSVFGSFDLSKIFSLLTSEKINSTIEIFGINIKAIDFMCIMLLIACIGRSAQFLFQTWFCGTINAFPAEVALMQSVTIISSGIIIFAKLIPLFEQSPIALGACAVIGALTVVLVGSIAMVETNLKKLIVHSISIQIGYMFFAHGISAYSISVTHLARYIFLDILLVFSVYNISAVVGEQDDINKLDSSLLKKAPASVVSMLVVLVLMSDVFIYKNYLSKSFLLEHATNGNYTAFGLYLYGLGLLGSFSTSFYCWRAIGIIFRPKTLIASSKIKLQKCMLVGVLISLITSLAIEVFTIDLLKILTTKFDNNWLALVDDVESDIFSVSSLTRIISMAISVLAICISWLMYVYRPGLSDELADRFGFIHSVFVNKYYIDEIYDLVFAKNFRKSFNSVFNFSRFENLKTNYIAYVLNNAGKINSYIERNIIYSYVLIALCLMIIIFGVYIATYLF